MASTLTSETRSRDKRDSVPLLLESFPIPPSFIPPSPLLSSLPASPLPSGPSPFVSPIPSPSAKQPLSAPPSAPLPPVPGPSPITEHETLMFISAARSRRASKMSLASTSSHYSHRDSVATLASNASGSSVPSLSPSTSVTPYDSARSLRSYSSTSSLSVPGPRYTLDRSPVIQPRISEEDATDLTRLSLDEISLHSTLPENLSDSEKVLEVGIGPSLSHRPESASRDSFSSTHARENASRTEEATVPSATPKHKDPAPGRPSLQRSMNKDLPPLPPAQPPPQIPLPPPPTYSRRPSSPDIKDILATTPRPRRKSSAGSGLRSRSTSRSVRSLRRRISEGVGARKTDVDSRRTSAATSVSRRTSGTSIARARSRPDSLSELAYEQSAMVPPADEELWDEDSFVSDYGVPMDETGTPFEMLDRDEEARLEKELDGDGSDSDSSLDLHTPLPHLMVKDGLLSPNSKLVQSSRNSTPLPNNRPGSVFSVASTTGSIMTKSGLFKDERDTVKRRVRHRDGRLLAGGIGLTTGLGWSDSEDEDAPSPLIRQISSNNLKKRAASASSLRSASSSLSHSYSGHTPDSRMEEFGMLPKASRTSAPPTSWHKPRTLPSRMPSDWRTSTGSSVSSVSSASALSHAQSCASVTSHRSAPAVSSLRSRGPDNSLGHIHEGEEFGFNTPSTSSTASLPMPITPDDIPARSRAGSLGAKRVPARLDLANASDLTPQDVVILTSASPSTMSMSTPSTASTVTPSAQRQTVPRPLRLPQSQGNLRRATDPSGAMRPLLSSASASTSPSTLDRASTGSLRQKPSLGSLRPPTSRPGPTSAPPREGIAFPTSPLSRAPVKSVPVARSASAGAAGPSKLKPRTGTGMAYRTAGSSASAGASVGTPVPPRAASGPGARPSMLRMPSTTSLRSAKGVGTAI
ncbi:hypothetical protein BN946_scf185033.g46 [Trametes cinnabarina]|uniref:Uncharacterized protein n=1 Tax=Pycnoporus cinnabarinus TaxID=5643 RepID=A0A060SXB4_PYCCI|nr:hypothetical protein BN946_scf185033.g46 [Trametes cinnabarina]